MKNKFKVLQDLYFPDEMGNEVKSIIISVFYSETKEAEVITLAVEGSKEYETAEAQQKAIEKALKDQPKGAFELIDEALIELKTASIEFDVSCAEAVVESVCSLLADDELSVQESVHAINRLAIRTEPSDDYREHIEQHKSVKKYYDTIKKMASSKESIEAIEKTFKHQQLFKDLGFPTEDVEKAMKYRDNEIKKLREHKASEAEKELFDGLSERIGYSEEGDYNDCIFRERDDFIPSMGIYNPFIYPKSKDTVTLSLKKYKKLKKKVDLYKRNETIFVKQSFFGSEVVYTDNKAVKELSLQLVAESKKVSVDESGLIQLKRWIEKNKHSIIGFNFIDPIALIEKINQIQKR